MATISPVIESVMDNGDGTFTVLLGYNNTFTTTQNIPISNGNKFTPAPLDRGQPTEFLPGRQFGVFSITWTGSNLTWTLGGSTATANASQAVLMLEATKNIKVFDTKYYTAGKATALAWVRSPVVSPGDTLILLAVSDTYGQVLNTDSAIKLELIRQGNDYRLGYFGAQSLLIDKTLGIDLSDNNWHLLGYECLYDGSMRFYVDGLNINPRTGTDSDGFSWSLARSTSVRPGGGNLWVPYLHKAGQSVFLYEVRFGVGFNLGLPWVNELMEIEKKKLGIA